MQTMRICFSVRVRRILPAVNGLGFKYLPLIHSDRHTSAASRPDALILRKIVRERAEVPIISAFSPGGGPDPRNTQCPHTLSNGRPARNAAPANSTNRTPGNGKHG